MKKAPVTCTAEPCVLYPEANTTRVENLNQKESLIGFSLSKIDRCPRAHFSLRTQLLQLLPLLTWLIRLLLPDGKFLQGSHLSILFSRCLEVDTIVSFYPWGYSLTPPVDAWNHTWYHTLSIVCSFMVWSTATLVPGLICPLIHVNCWRSNSESGRGYIRGDGFKGYLRKY